MSNKLHLNKTSMSKNTAVNTPENSARTIQCRYPQLIRRNLVDDLLATVKINGSFES
jgi:hypothetical protein